jgi:hypothetical protein
MADQNTPKRFEPFRGGSQKGSFGKPAEDIPQGPGDRFYRDQIH